jgi:hypothetical protein
MTRPDAAGASPRAEATGIVGLFEAFLDWREGHKVPRSYS